MDTGRFPHAQNGSALYIRKTHLTATIPQRKRSTDAALSLRSCQDACVIPGGRYIVDTGIQIRFPAFTFGRIVADPNLMINHGILVGGCEYYNSLYDGNIYVVLFNMGAKPFDIHSGDIIAQIIIQSYVCPAIIVDRNYFSSAVQKQRK